MDYPAVNLILPPLMGALIGWGTNYLAVKMLFHPRRRIHFGPFGIQGVFPNRQEAFARKLGQLVSSELFTVAEVTTRLESFATSPEALDQLVQRLQAAAWDRLQEQAPLLTYVLKPSHLRQILLGCLPEIKKVLQELTDSLSRQLQRDLDVHQIVEDKIAAFSVEKLENVVMAIMRRELRAIEIMGGVIGFLVGMLQTLIALVM